MAGVYGGRCGCEPVGGAGTVEADQGVEVDHAAQPVLGHLCVLERGDLGKSGGRRGEGLGDLSPAGRW